MAGAAIVVIVAVVAVVLLVSGSSGLSKAQWIAKADAACSKTFPQQASDVNKGDLKDYTRLAEQTLAQIRGLGLPSSGGGQVRAYLSLEQQGINLMNQGIAVQNSNSTTAQSDFQQAQQLLLAGARGAGQFGLHVCNSGQ